MARHTSFNLNEETGVVWNENGTVRQGYAIFTDVLEDDTLIARCYEIDTDFNLHSPVTFVDGKINQDVDFDFTESDFYLSPLPKREWSIHDRIGFILTYQVWCYLAETGASYKSSWPLYYKYQEYARNKDCYFCEIFYQRLCPLAGGYDNQNCGYCCKGHYLEWRDTENRKRKKEEAGIIRDMIGKWLLREDIITGMELKEMKWR
jgi:hypothetical protein